jgi:hypothetical protein
MAVDGKIIKSWQDYKVEVLKIMAAVTSGETPQVVSAGIAALLLLMEHTIKPSK